MADVSNHYVDIEQLQNTIRRINDIKMTNLSTESKILDELSELKNYIKINSKAVDNKKDDVQRSIEIYKKNSEGCIISFNAVMNKYISSVQNATSYINKQAGGVNNG